MQSLISICFSKFSSKFGSERRSQRVLAWAASAGSSVALLWGVLALLPSHKAEAQGIMAAPACQCSAPTEVAVMSTQVVHCICGGMSCVVSQLGAPNPITQRTNLMQCVK
jgi:hypothetical protein